LEKDLLVGEENAGLVAVGLTEMLQHAPVSGSAGSALVVRVLQLCCKQSAFAEALALHQVARVSCRNDLWSLAGSHVPLLLALAREDGLTSFSLQWPLLFEMCKRDARLLLQLIGQVSDKERKLMQSAELDLLMLSHGVDLANEAVVSGTLTKDGIVKAAALVDFPSVCASVVKLHHKLLVDHQELLVEACASALCGSSIDALLCPVPLDVLSERCQKRLDKIKATAAHAASVLLQIAKGYLFGPIVFSIFF